MPTKEARMSHSRRAIATAVMIATGLAIGLAPTGVARAGDAADVQELRREVRKMRGEVEAMTVAIMQANELERQRNAKLTKALEDQAAALPPAEPLPPAPSEADAPLAPTPTPAAAPASGDKAGKGAAHHKRHKRAGRAQSKSSR